MRTLLRVIFFVGDLITLNLSVFFSYKVSGISLEGLEQVNAVYLFIFSNLAWFFLINVSSPYVFSKSVGVLKIIKNQLSFLSIHLLVVASLIVFFEKTYSPWQTAAMYLLFVPFYFLWKLLFLYIINSISGSSLEIKNVIIVGQGELATQVSRYFEEKQGLNYKFFGLISKNEEGIPFSTMQKICIDNEVHEMYCCFSEINDAELRKLIDFGLNHFIQVKLITDMKVFSESDLTLEPSDRMPAHNQTVVPLDDIRNQIVKRIFDLVFSSLVIITTLWWLVPILGILIRLDSRGSIYFRQKRGGRNNRPFDCLKFRTMVINDEADAKQATKNDSRITRIGKFLRMSSLDEFPQFFNVWIGDMSIIGPRPHPLKLNEEFSKRIEGLMSRHYVKPGITGLAQSMGYRGETRNLLDMKNRIALDRFYIENWSLLLDFKIVVRTVISLIRGSEKAY